MSAGRDARVGMVSRRGTATETTGGDRTDRAIRMTMTLTQTWRDGSVHARMV